MIRHSRAAVGFVKGLVVFLGIASPLLSQVAETIHDPTPPPGPAGPPGPAWHAPLVLLYDNGPLITHPTGGFGGAPASRLQNTTQGNTILGFGAPPPNLRIADNFVVPSPGWYVNTITFFAYQTNSGTSSTLTGVNLRIWNGPPNVGTSSVVFGDTSTNRLASTSFSGIYRDSETLVGNNARPIMVAVANVQTYLIPGTYWVDFQISGSLASGPWVPPVTILGQPGKTGANALHFVPPNWGNMTDTGNSVQQDAPFLIDGDACNLTVPSGITVGTAAPACNAQVTYSPPPSVPTGCAVTITCTPPSGSTFALGTTTVNCSTSGGASASFPVTVVDDDAPSITCPGGQQLTTTNPGGAVVTYPSATASDNCTASPVVTCTPASGSTFPVGTTNVTCTARDGAGNTTSCSFPVEVRLQLAPTQIPTLSPWGLGALAVLLGGAAAWMMARRRQG